MTSKMYSLSAAMQLSAAQQRLPGSAALAMPQQYNREFLQTKRASTQQRISRTMEACQSDKLEAVAQLADVRLERGNL
jgi:hypothetical protein